MSADWLGVGALETPLGNLAFLLSARGIAAVRLGYPDWETAVDAVMPVRMADPRRMEGLSGGIDAVRYTVGSLIWIGAGGNPEPPGVARR
ncbi:MAG: hypothetical protein GYA33_04420, partial [Thermogutta sp.]|nr:hypothetical protein [Thermogutta sp.]